MYQVVDGTMCITVNDWVACGLTRNQFEHDSKGEDLKIFRRGLHGNTLIDVSSIKRRERMEAIARILGVHRATVTDFIKT